MLCIVKDRPNRRQVILRKKESNMINRRAIPGERPAFPKRAIITAGMPYGNKKLHFGHVGGMFVHADTFARFMRDRIGSENVIFVSGTDCYGSPIDRAREALVYELLIGLIDR